MKWRLVAGAQTKGERSVEEPTYISLIRYTDQGTRNIKESPKRLDAAKNAFKAMGGELKQWYLALGRYDAVVIRGPTMRRPARWTRDRSLGSIRTEGFRAFTEEEYRRLIAALP
jgi:uncharacterized protein with GYD domain